MGYVHPQTYLRGNGVELLTPEGGFSLLPYEDVKAVCFVRDFEVPEQASERKTFHTRPKMDGLWVRARFRDGEVIDGILSNNLLQIDSHGFTLTPPDPTSNNQRLFLPRTALTEIQVLGVVGSPLRRRKAKPAVEGQIGLFEE